jgi:ankyrin repeat protein
LLLAHGADVDESGDQGDRPIHDALGNLHVNIVILLLKHGASLDIRNDSNQTPEDYAVAELDILENSEVDLFCLTLGS